MNELITLLPIEMQRVYLPLLPSKITVHRLLSTAMRMEATYLSGLEDKSISDKDNVMPDYVANSPIESGLTATILKFRGYIRETMKAHNLSICQPPTRASHILNYRIKIIDTYKGTRYLLILKIRE